MEAKFVSISSGVKLLQNAQQASPKSKVERTAATEATTATALKKEVNDTSDSGKPLSIQVVVEDKSLDDVVEDLNRQIQSTTRALRFSIDERHGRPVVSVVDKETDQVIRQIPSEVALQVADALEEATGLLVSDRA